MCEWKEGIRLYIHSSVPTIISRRACPPYIHTLHARQNNKVAARKAPQTRIINLDLISRRQATMSDGWYHGNRISKVWEGVTVHRKKSC